MKKIQSYFLLALVLVCFSCDNEPYDGEIFVAQPVTVDPTDPDPEDPVDPVDPMPGASLQLNDYDYIKTFSSDTGDDITFITDFTINANNQFLSQQTSITLFGTTTNAVSNIIRDENSRVTQVRTTVDGVLMNRTIVTYNLDKVTEITFEDLQGVPDSFTFTFTHLNNEITRTKEDTPFSTKFTFDATTSKLIQRETMENGTVFKTENLSYDANGNLSTVVITGQDANTYNYTYDSNTNPLRNSLNDLYLYAVLNDEYDDQYEHWQAMIYSPNNVTNVSTQQGSSNLDIQYDANNRILTRNGTIFTSVPTVSSDAVITIDETFQYIN